MQDIRFDAQENVAVHNPRVLLKGQPYFVNIKDTISMKPEAGSVADLNPNERDERQLKRQPDT